MTRLRIASAQYLPEALPSLAAYRDKLARWVAEAAGAGAQLLVFPEYGAMEYAAPAGERVAADLAASLAAVSDALPEMDAAHAELARRHRVHILAASGPAARDLDRYVNAARLFAPSGQHGLQEKLIMTPFEHDWGISAGTGLKVFETALGRIGVAICYDSEFPLLVRAQAQAGAQIVLIPSCTEFVSGYHRVRTAALARALENTCVSVLAPTVGDATWSPAIDHNAGAAGIFVPADRSLSETGVLAEGALNRPQWVYADVDLVRLDRLRSTGEMRNATDWSRQPGAAGLAVPAQVVDLM